MDQPYESPLASLLTDRLNRESDLAESLSNSLSSLEQADHDALLMGARIRGRMAVVRRNFCLFVLFDLLVVSFIWLLLQMLTGDGDPVAIFNREIVNYNIKTSLFDLVMAAACRFTVLLLFYALLQLNTKWFVALTTAGTCGFLIFKVIYFNWKVSQQAGIQGISLLVSFFLAWVEVWFLDMRVIPTEQREREIRILGHVISQEPARLAHREPQIGSPYFTPLPEPDEDDDDEPVLDPEENKWVSIGKISLERAAGFLKISKWQAVVDDQNCIVSMTSSAGQEIFKVETVIKASPPELLISALYDSVDNATDWNPTLETSSRIKSLTSCCDIVYQVAQKSFGIKQRDMIIVRRKGAINDMPSIAYTSISHPCYPERRNIVRVDCGPSCWTVKPHESLEDSCHLLGIMNANIKISLPPQILRKSIANSLLVVTNGMRVMLEKL